ncbi:hypothetical protein E2C01_019458 [Portunus trituberculatus]|uniref:Uncharacterized protein n=1 Tax=Portunus trituberculatus TaxID=210409 RepID=A0A5B7E0H2_PORTR|nr:hypothetical protein [Portunus trituberculatus]
MTISTLLPVEFPAPHLDLSSKGTNSREGLPRVHLTFLVMMGILCFVTGYPLPRIHSCGAMTKTSGQREPGTVFRVGQLS